MITETNERGRHIQLVDRAVVKRIEAEQILYTEGIDDQQRYYAGNRRRVLDTMIPIYLQRSHSLGEDVALGTLDNIRTLEYMLEEVRMMSRIAQLATGVRVEIEDQGG